MNKQIDFISQPSPTRLRKEIQNICDSYSHPWDSLAELVQNAVDAIRLHVLQFGEAAVSHHIDLKINARTRSISIRDTGIGLSIDGYSDLMAPHGTNKDSGDHRIIGQKGVGLTYVIFNSNKFSLRSSCVSSNLEIKIENARNWRVGANDKLPKLEVVTEELATNTPNSTFTEIVVSDVEIPFSASDDLFIQSNPVIEFLIRTKTAIGSTRTIFGGTDVPISIGVSYEASNGEKTEWKPEFKFQLPEQFLAPNDVVDLDDFRSKAAAMTDEQKVAKLQGKVLRLKGAKARSGRNVKYYGLFVPSRSTWEKICTKASLFVNRDGEDPEYLFYGGIQIATRGMPTGIELPYPVKGNAGYWPNFYVLLEDDSLQFDLGRKHIPGPTQGLLKDIAHGLFNEATNFVGYVTTEPDVQSVGTVLAYEKQKTFAALDGLPDLGIEGLPFVKHPDSQEAALTALFHELVGKGMLKGYETLRMGFKATYDLWGRYLIDSSYVGAKIAQKIPTGTRLPIIIEFKYAAEALLNDLEVNKLFADIDLLVCWDFDEAKLARYGVTVEHIPDDEVLFHGSSHSLLFNASYKLGANAKKPMLSLRQFVDLYKKK